LEWHLLQDARLRTRAIVGVLCQFAVKTDDADVSISVRLAVI